MEKTGKKILGQEDLGVFLPGNVLASAVRGERREMCCVTGEGRMV